MNCSDDELYAYGHGMTESCVHSVVKKYNAGGKVGKVL